MNENRVTSGVVVLLFMSGPIAIAWTIIAIVVFALQGLLASGLGAHVGEERLKGSQPSLAHGNAATAVVFESRIISIAAPGQHVGPRTVFSRLCHSVSLVCFGGKPWLLTAAARGKDSPHGRSSPQALFPADADALPKNVELISLICLGNDREKSKCFSSQICFHDCLASVGE